MRNCENISLSSLMTDALKQRLQSVGVCEPLSLVECFEPIRHPEHVGVAAGKRGPHRRRYESEKGRPKHLNTRRIGNFSLTWGESLRWDDQRGRLYFVDCMKQQLHWLDAGLDRTIEAGVEQPSDVTFGGPALDRLFVVNIAVDIGIGPVASSS